jgi:hypothetical protein
MKSKTKHFLIGMLCLFHSLNALAQKDEYITHPDTLRIDLSDEQSITFAFQNINNVRFNNEFDSVWLAYINKIGAILKFETQKEPIHISLANTLIENEEREVVKVTPIDREKKVYMSRHNKLQNISELNHIHFSIQNITIDAYLTQTSNLSSLTSLNLKRLQSFLTEQQENISSPKKAYYVSTQVQGKLFTDLKITDSGVRDFLNLTVGIGAGLFRDKLVPEIALNAAITFGSKHGIKLHKFGVQSSFHYFFDRNENKNYDMHVNTFVTAFYKRNFSKSSLTDRWGGIGLGYLVKSAGSYFEGNTFKASIFITPNNSEISIIPELIVSDDFKTVFPSLRFGLTF